MTEQEKDTESASSAPAAQKPCPEYLATPSEKSATSAEDAQSQSQIPAQLQNTAFGSPGGPDPRAAQKASVAKAQETRSVRAAIRRFAGYTIEELQSMSRKRNIPAAHMLAIAKFQKAISGDVKAMQQIEESIDGKLVEKKVEAKVTLAELVLESYAEHPLIDGNAQDVEVVDE